MTQTDSASAPLPGHAASSAPTDEEFRRLFRAFLAEHHPGPRPKDAQAQLAWQKAWLAALYDAGFAGPLAGRGAFMRWESEVVDADGEVVLCMRTGTYAYQPHQPSGEPSEENGA